MLKDKKWILIAVGVVVGLLVLLNLWSRYTSRPTIMFSDVKIGEVAASIPCSGIIASESAALSSKMGGTIVWMGVDVGSQVNVGDALVKFDTYEQAKRQYDSMLKLYTKGLASKQQFDAAKTELDSSGVFSPISGLVVKKDHMVGETVAPGAPIVSVANTYKIWVDTDIDETDIGDVKEGAEVNIFSDAYDDEMFPGRVSWISKAAQLKEKLSVGDTEDARIFKARVNFMHYDPKLKPGMTVDVDVIKERKKNVIIASRDAIIAKDSKVVVYVLKGGRVREREVQLGTKDMVNVEIIKGLNPGEKVAVTGLDRLKDRMSVKVMAK